LDKGESKSYATGANGFGTTNGTVRLVFNAEMKVLTGYYDTNRADGYQWTEFGSFGLAGTGGVDGNDEWSLTDADQFACDLYGYSANMNIASGQIFLDNFMESGGVTPSGAPTPDPVARVPLRYPTNNPLLTAIANLTGNYRGFSPSFVVNNRPRPYNMDVAQDESGKLMVMGTVEGLATTRTVKGLANAQRAERLAAAEVTDEISTSLGSVVSVNNKPTVQVKISFAGTADELPVTTKTTGSGPAEIMDLGGGSNAVAMTMNITAKAAGIPFTLKNAPIMFPARASRRI
jgi:hypothetical protein